MNWIRFARKHFRPGLPGRPMGWRSPQGRSLQVAAVTAIWIGLTLGRLSYLQLLRYSEYSTRAQHQQRVTVEVGAKRAEIFDRNLRTLAMSVQLDSCFAVPAEIADPEMVARLLSRVLEVPAEEVAARLASSHSFVWIARKLPPEKAGRIAALNLRGIYFQKEGGRFYPKRGLAAHVLGYVDIDEKGLGGVEYSLDENIRSKPGKLLVLADARRRRYDSTDKAPAAGTSVVLTLDENIQYIAEKELNRAIAETNAQSGTVIVENPSNGELLAVANWPSFNPNVAKDSTPQSRMDRAASALYEPGSVFKIVTVSAALDQEITHPDEMIDCQNGAIYIAGHRIRDHKPFGLLTVSQVLANSSDVGAIKIGLRLGAPKFYEYIRAFGFGQPTGVDLPGEGRGMLRRVENWTPVSTGSISMGQEIGVTPLQLITAMSAIANGGVILRPHVVLGLRRGTQMAEPPQPQPRRVIRPTTAATMRHLLEGVVLTGTGKLARLDGYTAAGKTGTAQKYDPATGRYSTSQLVASFVGLAPINTPAITVLVTLDSAVGLHQGGQIAAPVFQRVTQQVLAYLNVPHDIPVAARKNRVGDPQSPEASLNDVTDFNPEQTDESVSPPDLSAAVAQEPTPGNPAPAVEFAEGEGILVPAFEGKGVREVTEECTKLGLNPVLIGTGIATEQSPGAGATIRRGSRITVQFTRGVLRGSTAHRRGDR